MSVITCGCGRYVDTDDDVEGVWGNPGDGGSPNGYWCSQCLEQEIEDQETAETSVIMAAFQKQDPAAYADTIAQYDEESPDAG